MTFDMALSVISLSLPTQQQVNNFTAEMQAPSEYHRFLIGKGGANIRRVRDRTGAGIIFLAPHNGEPERTIVGREEGVRLAQKELEALVKNLVGASSSSSSSSLSACCRSCSFPSFSFYLFSFSISSLSLKWKS